MYVHTYNLLYHLCLVHRTAYDANHAISESTVIVFGRRRDVTETIYNECLLHELFVW